jgi:SAM-dependent methyltransferase
MAAAGPPCRGAATPPATDAVSPEPRQETPARYPGFMMGVDPKSPEALEGHTYELQPLNQAAAFGCGWLFFWLTERCEDPSSEQAARAACERMDAYLASPDFKRWAGLTEKALEIRPLEMWGKTACPDKELLQILHKSCHRWRIAEGRPFDEYSDGARLAARYRVEDIEDELMGFLFRVGVTPPQRYLDVGCSAGAFSHALGSKGLGLESKGQIFACDLPPYPPKALVEKAEPGTSAEPSTRMPVTYSQMAEDCTLPYPDAHFQYVSCIAYLHLFSQEKRERLLGEFRRVLEPGGVLIVLEHDCVDSEYGAAFLNFVRYVDAFVLSSTPPGSSDRRGVSLAAYRPTSEWVAAVEASGFQHFLTKEPERGTRLLNSAYTFFTKSTSEM